MTEGHEAACFLAARKHRYQEEKGSVMRSTLQRQIHKDVVPPDRAHLPVAIQLQTYQWISVLEFCDKRPMASVEEQNSKH